MDWFLYDSDLPHKKNLALGLFLLDVKHLSKTYIAESIANFLLKKRRRPSHPLTKTFCLNLSLGYEKLWQQQ